MNKNVLFVDDEELLLNAIARILADTDLRMFRAGSGEQALALLRDTPMAVIVSDHQMPGMLGTELLARTRTISPDTTRILMTGHADLTTAVDSINLGEVFRFIIKPWEKKLLLNILEEAIGRYHLLASLRRSDESTLLSLAQTIELKDPYTKGHCDRVANYALMIAGALKLPAAVQTFIKYGAWLHDCGKIGVAEAILNKSGRLTPAEMEIVKKHPAWGAEVARKAQLHQSVINIIHFHHERYDGLGYPAGLRGEEIPLEARIVAIADVFDAISTNRPYRAGSAVQTAWQILEQAKGSLFDPGLVELFHQSFHL